MPKSHDSAADRLETYLEGILGEANAKRVVLDYHILDDLLRTNKWQDAKRYVQTTAALQGLLKQ